MENLLHINIWFRR